MEIAGGARQAADLIGKAFGNSESSGSINERTRRLIVLPNTQPTEEETQQFDELVSNGTLYLSEYGLMIRVNKNIATGVNLRSGYYALGQRRLERGLLYLARRYEGWEDPTGTELKQKEENQS